MKQKFKIKKGDQVIVITGKDKGKKGEVIKLIADEARVIVSGVNVVKKHQKPSGMQAGGIISKEAPIHISNVMHADPKTGKPVRVGVKVLKDGEKTRYSKKSGETIG